VSAQSIMRSGATTYQVTDADAQGSVRPPQGRPFTCTTPTGAAMQADFGFDFNRLTPGQADEWTRAFKEGNRTVYVSMSIGDDASDGTEWLIIDLREATVLAALTQPKSAGSEVGNGQSAAQSQPASGAAPSGEGEGEAGHDDVYGCSVSGAPRNAAGLGVLTLLGLVFLRTRRLAARAR
jgi:hypothetical protein